MQCTEPAPIRQAEVFPKCDLHGTRLVKNLPAGCPMRKRDALQALAELQNRGWRRLSQQDGGGNRDLMEYETCLACFGRCANSPHIQELRRASAETQNKPLPPVPPRTLPGDSPLRQWRDRMGFDAAQLAAEHILAEDGLPIHELARAILDCEKGRAPATVPALLPLWAKVGQELMDAQTEWLRTRPLTQGRPVATVTLPAKRREGGCIVQPAKPAAVSDILERLNTRRRRSYAKH